MNEKTRQRLGLDFDHPNVDPENVEAFAKIVRAIGASSVVIFLTWGLLYDFSYGRSPFMSLVRELGLRRYDENIIIVMVPIIAILGWRRRFFVGSLLTAAFFKITGLLGKAFKSV